jgi:signal transduction histidine kinase
MNTRDASGEAARLRDQLRQLVHACGHDLAEPARTIKSFLGLIERRHGGALAREALEFMGYAVDAAARLETMLLALLELGRIGTEPAPAEPVPLGPVAAAAIAGLGPGLDAAGARVSVGALPALPGDKRLWRRLFAILVENALRYRGPAPPDIRIEASPGRITVADNGIGIDPRFAERIFEPFQRLHTRDDIPGCGMGLAIARRIAEHHGATLAVEASPEGGAVFVIGVPAA